MSEVAGFPSRVRYDASRNAFYLAYRDASATHVIRWDLTANTTSTIALGPRTGLPQLQDYVVDPATGNVFTLYIARVGGTTPVERQLRIFDPSGTLLRTVSLAAIGVFPDTVLRVRGGEVDLAYDTGVGTGGIVTVDGTTGRWFRTSHGPDSRPRPRPISHASGSCPSIPAVRDRSDDGRCSLPRRACRERVGLLGRDDLTALRCACRPRGAIDGGLSLRDTASCPLDSTAPTVSLQQPTNGATLSVGQHSPIDIACNDTGGSGVAVCRALVFFPDVTGSPTWLDNGEMLPTGETGVGRVHHIEAIDAQGNGTYRNYTEDPTFDVTYTVQASVDANGDGIIDTLQPAGTPAGSFTDNSTSPPTTGSIVNANGLAVTITDAADAADGVKITVGAGSGKATFSVCGFTLKVSAGSEVVVTCGSVTVEVVQGSAEVVLGGGVVVVTALGGGAFKVSSPGGGVFSVENTGSAGVTSLRTASRRRWGPGNSLQGTVSSTLYLHGSTANPQLLTLDGSQPTSSTAKSRDSAAVKFAGGNAWKDVGTWNADGRRRPVSGRALGPARLARAQEQ